MLKFSATVVLQATVFASSGGRSMLNNQSGLGGPTNSRSQFNQFAANQLQGGGNAFQLSGKMPSLLGAPGYLIDRELAFRLPAELS